MASLDFKTLHEAVAGTACAFRSRTRLQPADGPGGKIFPPTHLNGEYATEERQRIGDDGSVETVLCVLVDSVQLLFRRSDFQFLRISVAVQILPPADLYTARRNDLAPWFRVAGSWMF